MRVGFLVLAALGTPGLGCGSGSDEEAVKKSRISAGCSINSDCNSPLVCAFRRCHVACESTRDCTAPQLCVASDRPFYVCQLGDEVECNYNSQCSGAQICGIDGKCRDQCSADRDCSPGQLCRSRTCAEPAELVDGGLPTKPSVDAGSGQPCTYNSDCPGEQICRQGLCAAECLRDKDCQTGQLCGENQRCQAVVPDAGSAGSGGTGGGSGGDAGTGGSAGVGGGSAGSAGTLGSGGTSGSAGVDAGGDSSSTGGSAGSAGAAGADAAIDCPALGWTRPCAPCPDGATGTQSCVAGDGGLVWGPCQGATTAETCDGKDNDCDGQIDNGAGFECRLNQTASCTPQASCPLSSGTKTCVSVSGVCRFGACQAGTEVCNGLDDNCDGTADNGPGMQCVRGTTPASCTYSQGSCAMPGIPSCDANCRLQCAPKAEVCDGADNDCDGTADVNAQLGIECAKGTSGPCTVSACSTTFGGTRSCSSSCTWGNCIVTDACNDADDTCDGHVDEGQSYVSGSGDVLLSPVVTLTGVAAVLDGSTLWVAWSDSRLGSQRLSVGKFSRLTGAPLGPIGDIGNGTTGIGLYGSFPMPPLAVMVGSDAWFVFTVPLGDKILLVRATGGNSTTPPALSLYPFSANSFQLRLGGIATDGTNLYLSYAPAPGYQPPFPLRVARVSTAGSTVWDTEIVVGQQNTAALVYDGTNLHAAHCTPARVLAHARLTTAGTIDVADHAVSGAECEPSAGVPVGLDYSQNALTEGSWVGGQSYQTNTISLAGTLAGVSHTFNVPGGGDYRFAARAAAPLTFVVTSQASSFRVAADGFINSRAAEPAPPISQGARSVALYPPGGPLFVYMNPSGSEIRMLRLQCP